MIREVDAATTRRSRRRCAEEAARSRCASLPLDSGVGADRRDAHALYFAHGMGIHSYDFAREL